MENKVQGKITLYNDGAVVKVKNRKVVLKKNNDVFLVQFIIVDGDVRCRSTHKVLKGKAVVTSLKLSTEAVEGLAMAYFRLKNRSFENSNQSI
jgi:hypothetical protein